MGRSRIEWTEATWNPVTGCNKVSPGCKNCYAERMAKRLAGRYGYPTDKPFQVTLHPDRLEQPLRWKTPRRVFVNSMSDLFHESVPNDYIDSVFAVMLACPYHTFQVLTKRAARMASYCNDPETPRRIARLCSLELALKTSQGGAPGRLGRVHREGVAPWPLPNVWLGVSVEDQQRADERIPLLLQTPAAVRFLSCEPLLGPIDFGRSSGCRAGCSHEHCLPFEIDWVIVGGESGPGARPMHPDWVRSIRDQCVWMEVPFFFKQWGDWREACPPDDPLWNGHPPKNLLGAHGTYFLQLGKKATGRILDGQTWDQIPGTVPPSVDYP